MSRTTETVIPVRLATMFVPPESDAISSVTVALVVPFVDRFQFQDGAPDKASQAPTVPPFGLVPAVTVIRIQYELPTPAVGGENQFGPAVVPLPVGVIVPPVWNWMVAVGLTGSISVSPIDVTSIGFTTTPELKLGRQAKLMIRPAG
jgi:hypothetical protein